VIECRWAKGRAGSAQRLSLPKPAQPEPAKCGLKPNVAWPAHRLAGVSSRLKPKQSRSCRNTTLDCSSIKSLDCSSVEAKYKDDTFDTESPDQVSMCVFPPSPISIILSNESDTEAAHRLPVLEKNDPTWAPRSPPSTSLIVSEDKTDWVARFDALKHEIDQASRTIVSRHVEESDRHLREEWLAKQTPMPMPMPIAITNVGGKPRARVAKKKSLATLPVLPESSSDCEDGLEGNNVTEEDVTGDLFTKLE
jgi:hypothetical protein